jgi:general secretion pathway protein B
MSYILEALKKAQAERQLGATPTIHAPTLHSVAEQPAGKGMNKPVMLALLAMGVVIAGLLALVWSKSQQTPPPAPQQAAPAQTAAPAPAPAPVTPTAAPEIAIVAVPEQPVATAKASPKRPELKVVPQPEQQPQPARAVASQEEVSQTMRDLPEPIQRAIPQIAVGGYIYSKNPADRLLLIDKVLRHEGEEVAPGLTLEKLLPKSAVFNYKGYRYRVPY